MLALKCQELSAFLRRPLALSGFSWHHTRGNETIWIYGVIAHDAEAVFACGTVYG